MKARPYKTIPKSDRLKLEVKSWQNGNKYRIYARPEQFEPFFHTEGGFFIDWFLSLLDSYRTCGFEGMVPLDNVRVVKLPPPQV